MIQAQVNSWAFSFIQLFWYNHGMACSTCFTAFLDTADPGLRTAIHGSLNTMLALPMDAINAELGDLQDFLGEVDAQFGDLTDQLGDLEDQLGDINSEMLAQSIIPGNCPQLDFLISQLQSSLNVTKFFTDPIEQQVLNAQNAVAGMAATAAAVNSLVSTAGGLIC